MAEVAGPIQEQKQVRPIAMFPRERQQVGERKEVDRHFARTLVVLTSSHLDPGTVLLNVVLSSAPNRGPLRARRDAVGDDREELVAPHWPFGPASVLRGANHGVIQREDLFEGKPSLLRLGLARERDGEHFVKVAAPESAALRELHAGPPCDELLVDRAVDRPIASALLDVVVDEPRFDLAKKNGRILGALEELPERIPQDTRLLLVELDRFLAPLARRHAAASIFDQELEGVLEGGRFLRVTFGISGDAFELTGAPPSRDFVP